MITLLFAPLLLSIIFATSQPAPVRVDVLEINTYTDRDGNRVLQQALLRRWLRLANGNGHYVEQWRIVSDVQPFWRHGKRYVSLTTSDGIITIEARSYRETTTDHDPELAEQAIYPPEQRRAYLHIGEK